MHALAQEALQHAGVDCFYNCWKTRAPEAGTEKSIKSSAFLEHSTVQQFRHVKQIELGKNISVFARRSISGLADETHDVESR